MRVLIACEESQAVCKAFRLRGHEAYSCDVQEPSGGHPEWHIHGDALAPLDGGQVITMDDKSHYIDAWDLLIAHPPCTYLSKAGANRLIVNGKIQEPRYENGIRARDFFLKFWNSDVYMFGDPYIKTTCLWLKNLPMLFATDVVVPTSKWVSASDHRAKKTGDAWAKSGHRSAKVRSKTFPGIANAMSMQWEPK